MISLQVENVSKSYGTKKVFSDITFTQKSGVLGIAGPNGSGKSTLLKCLARLLAPSSGKISWLMDGKTLDGTDLNRYIGFVAPYINLYQELTILENIQFVLQLRNDLLSDADLSRHLRDFDLHSLRQRPFGVLSTGQQQRAKLAVALVYEPSILFLDEPGANLDDEGKAAIRRTADRYREKNNLVILASNDSRELSLADRVYSVEKTDFI